MTIQSEDGVNLYKEKRLHKRDRYWKGEQLHVSRRARSGKEKKEGNAGDI